MDDPFFGAPFIDEDVWPDVDVRHRYVHGGFEGTDTRFAFYFLEPEHYGGRFIQMFEGSLGGHEGRDAHPPGALAGYLMLAKELQAYLVECNTGHIGPDHGPDDQTITAYRANAQSARYARRLAEEMYGSAPHHGYQFGGSSGGLRSIFAMEHVYDQWDGAVPFVAGPFVPHTVGTSMTLPRMRNAETTLALLRPTSKAALLDAVEPGGGNTFAGLDPVEREAVDALFASGFPRRALFQYSELSGMTLITEFIGPLGAMISQAPHPGYIEDFWNVAGYAGADGELDHRLIDTKATVREIRSATELAEAGITAHPFADIPGGFGEGRGLTSDTNWPTDTLFADLRIVSGAAAGKQLTCYGTFDDVLVVGGLGAAHLANLAPGDEVAIDNRRFLAAAFSYRYHDEREITGGGLGARADQMMPGYIPSGVTGRFHGKMILFNATLDVLAPPAGAVLYDEMVRDHYGDEADSKFRLWWVDNSCHTGLPIGSPGSPAPATRAVMYGGVMQEALRCVIEWVEEGIEPAASTRYQVQSGQIELPAAAAERQGVQPVATASANGESSAEVAPGTSVTFDVLVEAPPRGGKIIDVVWDFDGSGQYAFRHENVDGSSTSMRLTTTHTFNTPGTYFPAVRVTSERDGSVDAILYRMENLDRVRVIVT
jgi:hypothetical protein